MVESRLLKSLVHFKCVNMIGDLRFVNIPLCVCFTLIPKYITFFTPLFLEFPATEFPRFEQHLTVSTFLSIIACFTFLGIFIIMS